MRLGPQVSSLTLALFEASAWGGRKWFPTFCQPGLLASRVGTWLDTDRQVQLCPPSGGALTPTLQPSPGPHRDVFLLAGSLFIHPQQLHECGAAPGTCTRMTT